MDRIGRWLEGVDRRFSGDRREPKARLAAGLPGFRVELESRDAEARLPQRLSEVKMRFRTLDYQPDQIIHHDLPLAVTDQRQELMPGLLGRIRQFEQENCGHYAAELELLVASPGEHGDAPRSTPLPYAVEVVDAAGKPAGDVQYEQIGTTGGWERIDGEIHHLVLVKREWQVPDEHANPPAAFRSYIATELRQEELDVLISDLPVPACFKSPAR